MGIRVGVRLSQMLRINTRTNFYRFGEVVKTLKCVDKVKLHITTAMKRKIITVC